MDYEKLYKEALERASKYYNANTNKGYREIFEDIFHEFKESEDERIRKGLIKGLSAMRDIHKHQTFSDDAINIDDAIAWLEKQGEHKCDCEYVGCHVNDVKRWCHKKQAEILYEKCNTECPEYQKQDRQKPIEQDTETHDLWVYIREWNDKFGRLPKDEDELASCIDYVMKRQKAAWSEKHIADVFEKVGLAKIVREQGNDQLTNAVQSTMIELSKQQNTAWSEEDESMFLMCSNAIAAACAAAYYTTEEMNKMQNWLKSLKPNHWKPSEEQMEALVRCLYEDIHQDKELYAKIESLYNDLKNL